MIGRRRLPGTTNRWYDPQPQVRSSRKRPLRSRTQKANIVVDYAEVPEAILNG
jgi:hypothetical protein